MKFIQIGHLSRGEQARRHLIAAALIGVFMFNPTLPVWLTLVALYPFFTALFKWDPLNAALEILVAEIKGRGAAMARKPGTNRTASSHG